MTQNPFEEQEDYEAHIRESFKPVAFSAAVDESVEDGTEGGYIVTDRNMTDRLDEYYIQKLIDRYGDISELTSTVNDDMDDFGPAPDYSEIDPEFYGHHPE